MVTVEIEADTTVSVDIDLIAAFNNLPNEEKVEFLSCIDHPSSGESDLHRLYEAHVTGNKRLFDDVLKELFYNTLGRII